MPTRTAKRPKTKRARSRKNPRGVYYRAVQYSDIERRIMSLCRQGYTEPEIARMMGYSSRNGVKLRKRLLMAKLGANSTPELIRNAQRRKII